MQADAIKKILWPAMPPLVVVSLLLAAMLVAPYVGELRKVGSAKGHTIEEARQLLEHVSRARIAVQTQMTNSIYPLDGVLAQLERRPPPILATAVEPKPGVKAGVTADAVPPPAQPVVASSLPEPVLAVTGIASSGLGRIACVNNRSVAEGGMVEGYKVVKIEPNQVTFEDLKGHTRIVRIK